MPSGASSPSHGCIELFDPLVNTIETVSPAWASKVYQSTSPGLLSVPWREDPETRATEAGAAVGLGGVVVLGAAVVAGFGVAVVLGGAVVADGALVAGGVFVVAFGAGAAGIVITGTGLVGWILPYW